MPTRSEHTSRNGLSDNKPKYDAIRVCSYLSLEIGMKLTQVQHLVWDLCGEVGMNWELPWADISAGKKAKLYQAVSISAQLYYQGLPYSLSGL
jgi:hypothetical protein